MNEVSSVVDEIPDAPPLTKSPPKLASLVTSGKQKATRRVMLYGVAGVGKSTWAASAGALFLPTEDGSANIDCSRLPLSRSYNEVLYYLSMVEDEGGYPCLAIDSLDWLEPLIWDHVCEKHGKKSIGDIGYGKGYEYALDVWRDFFARLDSIRFKHGMHMILLAHANVELFQDPRTNDYQRYTPRLHKKATPIAIEWCDEVLFAHYETVVHSSEDNRMGKGKGTGRRVLYTEERPFALAKNRLGMPAEIDLSFAEYVKYL